MATVWLEEKWRQHDLELRRFAEHLLRRYPIMRQRMAADDLVNETVAKAHPKTMDCQGESVEEERKWLFPIMHNCAIDAIRKICGRGGDRPQELREQQLQADLESETGTYLAQLADDSSGASTKARRNEEIERLQDFIEHLPPDQREVVRLRRFEDLTVEEIAARLGKTKGAVDGLLFRALVQLRKWMNPTGSES